MDTRQPSTKSRSPFAPSIDGSSLSSSLSSSEGEILSPAAGGALSEEKKAMCRLLEGREPQLRGNSATPLAAAPVVSAPASPSKLPSGRCAECFRHRCDCVPSGDGLKQ